MNILAVVPARGGSKGLPGKNLADLGGLSLLGHAIRFAERCDGVEHTIVSTDSPEIAAAARGLGGDVPFARPAELAGDDVGIWPVLQHALAEVDAAGRYDAVLLVSPTAPFRLPGDVADAQRLLAGDLDADGVVGAVDPGFSVAWTAVRSRDGWLEPLFPDARAVVRRQDAERILRISGSIYLFRAEFVREQPDTWLGGRHLLLELPRDRGVDVDTADDLALARAMLAAGVVTLPWL